MATNPEVNGTQLFKYKVVGELGAVLNMKVLLGETAVGKSSIVQRYVRDQFLENQESTIGGA